MRRLPLLTAVLVSACSPGGGGGSGSGRPIDARALPLELVTCRARLGEEFNLSEVYASTLTGLGERKLSSRAGLETGVRAHPTEAMTVVLARQTRFGEPSSFELYEARADNSAVDVRLTRDGHSDQDPCFSADGAAVLFTSERGGVPAIWRIGRDGTGLAPFSQPPAGAADRHPDARRDRVVWSRSEGGRARLYLSDAAGGNPVPITDGGGLVGSEVGDVEPALAPDAGAVVFARRDAAGATRLHVLDLATAIVTALPVAAGGGDRWPRFLPGDRILCARTAPDAGLLGLHLWTTARDGSDAALLSLDARLTHPGFDVLAGTSAMRAPGGPAVPGDLDDDDVSLVLGQRTLGGPNLLRTKDGSGVQMTTVAFEDKEAAGLYVPFKLPIQDAADVARVTVSVTCALALAGPDARVRVSVKDYVRNRYDVAWDRPVTTTAAFEASFTFASLAHVDRDRWIRVQVACELPAGQRTEFTVDAVELTITPAAQ